MDLVAARISRAAVEPSEAALSRCTPRSLGSRRSSEPYPGIQAARDDATLKHALPFMLLLVLRPVGFQNEQLPLARVPQLACNPSRLRCCDKRSSAFSGSIIPCFLSFAIISRTNEGACAPNESRVYSFLVESSRVRPSPDGDAPAPQQSREEGGREWEHILLPVQFARGQSFR